MADFQLPAHQHQPNATRNPATSRQPGGRLLAQPLKRLYGSPVVPTEGATAPIGMSGGSQPHDNVMPYLCVDFIISLYGVFPSPT